MLVLVTVLSLFGTLARHLFWSQNTGGKSKWYLGILHFEILMRWKFGRMPNAIQTKPNFYQFIFDGAVLGLERGVDLAFL
jgi:hypothetical protein